MAGNGKSTLDTDQVGIIDELLGNVRSGDVKKTARIPIDSLANQLLGAGPIRESLTSGVIFVPSWAVLAGTDGAYDAQGAEVPDTDAGTHLAATATGYDGASTPNAGRFSFNDVWSRWVRIGATGLATKVETSVFTDRLNPYIVACEGFITVDASAGKVRFPNLRINRGGALFKSVLAADYGQTVFEFTQTGSSGTPGPTQSGNANFFYIDVALIGTATVPIKQLNSMNVPTPGRDIIPLGFSYRGLFTPFIGCEVRYTNRPVGINAAVGNLPIVVDRLNRYGGGVAVYVPKIIGIISPNSGASVLGTDLSINGNLVLTNASEPGVLSNHVKVPITDVGFGSIQNIIVDLATQTASLVVYPAQAGGSDRPFLPLVSLYGESVSSQIGLDVVFAEDTDKYAYYGEHPVVAERDVILVPRGFYRNARTGLITAKTFADGAKFQEISAPNYALTNSYPVTIYFDGNDNTFKSFQAAGAYPHEPGFRAAKLATFMKGVPGGDKPVAGYGGFATQKNQCPYGKAADGLDKRNTGTVMADITDTNLLALGFTRGWQDPTTKRPFAGMNLPNFRPGARGFMRIYVQTDTDNDFGIPRFYFNSPTTQAIGQVLLDLEKKISARAAIYSASFITPNDPSITYIWAGPDRVTAGDTQIRTATGLQFHIGDSPAFWIMREDYTSQQTAEQIAATVAATLDGALPDVTPDFTLPPRLFLTAGRELPFYPQNVLTKRADGETVEATISSIKATDANQPFARTGKDLIEIDPDRLGTTVEFNFRKRQATYASNRYRQTCSVTLAPQSGSGVRTVLCIGDSLMNRRIPQYLSDRLTARGYTPSFIGTVVGNTATGDNGPLGEAREGHEFADLIYMNTDAEAPVVVGGEAAYMALSKTNKVTKNPFIRPATGGDPADRIFNGYIFDMAFYLSRFTLANPTHIILDLHTNDISQQTASTALLQIQNGLRVVINQIRAALPSVKIGLNFHVLGRSAVDGRWATHMTLLREHISFVRALGDANVHVLAPYMHQSFDAGWPVTTSSTDAATGMITGTISDIIHMDDLNRHIAAEVWASFVAAT